MNIMKIDFCEAFNFHESDIHVFASPNFIISDISVLINAAQLFDYAAESFD